MAFGGSVGKVCLPDGYPVEALGTISSWCDGLKYQDGEVSELLD